MTELLGQLASVEVRRLWPHEAADFTPWLAREENMSMLGVALGLELEAESTEVAVGPYSADILARDSAGNYVVVENQLAKTDHDHLGKSITYAAVLGARSVVWVAPEFTDEHRKALDWLNDNTTEEVSFYGVQVELWSIDNSRPAVRFNVVSRPAEIVRQATARKSGELSDARRLQLAWWTAFREALVASKLVGSTQTPRAQYWYEVALGRSGVYLSNTANTYDGRIGVRVYLHGKSGGDSALEQLSAEREAIEREVGHALQWNPNPQNRDKVIAIYRDVDLTDRKRWDEHIDWMLDMSRRFLKAFGPRAKKLDLNRRVETPDSEDEQ